MVRDLSVLVFVSVTVPVRSTLSGPLFPKSKIDVLRETWDTTLPDPTPESATENPKLTFPAAVLTARAPRIDALFVGLKATLIVQLCPFLS